VKERDREETQRRFEREIEALGEEMEDSEAEGRRNEGVEREGRGRAGRPSKVELLRRERRWSTGGERSL